MAMIEVNEDALNTLKRMVEELQAQRDELRSALQILFDDYKSLADSGDAGFWKLEEQDAGKIALKALENSRQSIVVSNWQDRMNG